jgi:hypothetical protein
MNLVEKNVGPPAIMGKTLEVLGKLAMIGVAPVTIMSYNIYMCL